MAAPSHITDDQVQELGLAIADEVKGKSQVVRPGDSIILCFDFQLNMEQYDQLSEYCKKILPGVNVIAFPEVKEMRVFRPSDPEGM